MKKFTYKKVTDHFIESKEYKTRKGIIHDEEDPLMIDFIQKTASNGNNILEVGGGSGAFLDLVAETTDINDVYNMELVYHAYKDQVNKSISLIGGDALNIPFKDCSFDWVILKNLLHHLVGNTRKESKKLVGHAIGELTRVTKHGGYIIVLDQYNNNKLYSSIVFYITLVLAVFKISSKTFGLGKNVIVSFLTPNELHNLFGGVGNIDIIFSTKNKINVSKKLKYTLLMSDIGRLVLIGRVKKD